LGKTCILTETYHACVIQVEPSIKKLQALSRTGLFAKADFSLSYCHKPAMSGFFIDADIAKARTLSPGFYTDPRYFEEAREKIFAPSWQFIGSADLVAQPGACYPFQLLEEYLPEPLVISRDQQSRLRCLSNVCTHRGNLLVNTSCHALHLRCKYHGRIFGLDGKMISMPEFREVKDFPTAADDLTSLPLFQWGKWLFTCLNEMVSPALVLKEMMERLSWLPVNEFVFRPELSKDYHVNAHWALYCENYLEGFHIPFVHAGLNAVIDYGGYATELFRYSSLQLGIAKEGEACFTLPASSPDHGKNVAAYYFWIFPNMMFNFYPWGLSVNVVKPLSIDRTRVSFLTYMWKEDQYNRGAGSDLDKVEMEDEEVVQNVQKGVRSRFYDHGRYSVTREQGTHHFHRLIAGFMN
jgi:choline monooxygenase